MRLIQTVKGVSGLLIGVILAAGAAAALSAQNAPPEPLPGQGGAAAAGGVDRNCDMSGEWGAVSNEDYEDRRYLGTNPGDYTGFPLTDAARQFSDTWNASILSLPTQQALPHPAQYIMRGPGPNFRMTKLLDPATREFNAYALDGVYGRNDRTIWMDGRPHPPEYVEYTWDGFSTGRCERGMLVVTTTHMKYGYHRRNGVPASIKSKMTEYFIRHGTDLTIVQFTEDPPYLEEPLVRTTDFRWNPTQSVGPPGTGFEIVEEITSWPKGHVPSYPLGTEHREFAETLGIPFEASRGYKEAMYPEYLPKLRALMRNMPAATSTASTAR